MTCYATILNEAHAAAARTIATESAARPEDLNTFDCGYAWVTIDGSSPLARHCRAEVKKAGGESKSDRKFGSKGYPRGWEFWMPGHYSGQSIRIHRVGAEAFALALANHGVVATTGSRLN